MKMMMMKVMVNMAIMMMVMMKMMVNMIMMMMAIYPQLSPTCQNVS